jgi:hypothetical protein
MKIRKIYQTLLSNLSVGFTILGCLWNSTHVHATDKASELLGSFLQSKLPAPTTPAAAPVATATAVTTAATTAVPVTQAAAPVTATATKDANVYTFNAQYSSPPLQQQNNVSGYANNARYSLPTAQSQNAMPQQNGYQNSYNSQYGQQSMQQQNNNMQQQNGYQNSYNSQYGQQPMQQQNGMHQQSGYQNTYNSQYGQQPMQQQNNMPQQNGMQQQNGQSQQSPYNYSPFSSSSSMIQQPNAMPQQGSSYNAPFASSMMPSLQSNSMMSMQGGSYNYSPSMMPQQQNSMMSIPALITPSVPLSQATPSMLMMSPTLTSDQHIQMQMNTVAEELTNYRLATEKLVLQTGSAATRSANAAAKAAVDAADFSIAAQASYTSIKNIEQRIMKAIEMALRSANEENNAIQASPTATTIEKETASNRVLQLEKTYKAVRQASASQQESAAPIQNAAKAAMYARNILEPVLSAAESTANANKVARTLADSAKAAELETPLPIYDLKNPFMAMSAAKECSGKPKGDCDRRSAYCGWKEPTGCQFKCEAVNTASTCQSISNGNMCAWVASIETCKTK